LFVVEGFFYHGFGVESLFLSWVLLNELVEEVLLDVVIVQVWFDFRVFKAFFKVDISLLKYFL